MPPSRGLLLAKLPYLERSRTRLNAGYGVVAFFGVFVFVDYLSNRTALPTIRTAEIVSPTFTLYCVGEIEHNFPFIYQALATDTVLLDLIFRAGASRRIDKEWAYSVYVDISAHVKSPQIGSSTGIAATI